MEQKQVGEGESKIVWGMLDSRCLRHQSGGIKEAKGGQVRAGYEMDNPSVCRYHVTGLNEIRGFRTEVVVGALSIEIPEDLLHLAVRQSELLR